MRHLTCLSVLVFLFGCAGDAEPIRLLDDGPERPYIEFLGPLLDDPLPSWRGNPHGPTVELTDPVAETRTATPISDLTLTFSEPYDPTTIRPGTVWLVERESRRRVPVDFDTTQALRVVLFPQRPLADGSRYHVHVEGVRAEGGVAVTRYDGQFSTRFHFPASFIQFDESGVFKWFDGAHDVEGRVWSATYVYAGDDGVMHTVDDRENMQSNYHRDERGDNTLVRVHNSVGPRCQSSCRVT